MKTLNNYIPLMENKAVTLTERALINTVVLKTIQVKWTLDLKRDSNYNLATLSKERTKVNKTTVLSWSKSQDLIIIRTIELEGAEILTRKWVTNMIGKTIRTISTVVNIEVTRVILSEKGRYTPVEK